MRRAGIRIANVVLFALCCFLVASVFNDISAGFLMLAPAVTPPSPAVENRQVRTWEERRPIIERNLFGAQIVAAPVSPPPPPEEDLEETQLPLRLLGTVASANPAASRATIEDKGTRKHEVVRLGDFLQSHEQVQVAGIERRRVILLNENRREELRLEEDERAKALAPKRTPRRGRPVRNKPRQNPEKELAERLQALAIDEGQGRSGPELITQGRFSPEYSENQIVGMQIDDIEPGGLYDKIGLKDGDVITSVNGISIESISAANEMLLEFSQADEFQIELRDSEEPITVTPEQLDKLLNE